jgi:transcription antitermination protein NusB
MKHSRHRARECALQILYKIDLESEQRVDARAERSEKTDPLSPIEISQLLQKHFEHFDVPGQTREFAAELVAGTLLEKEKLDGEIELAATGWKISRMATIDRNLLRMSLYELRHHGEETPYSVTLDEAVELAKTFGGAETPSFVNAVLDTLRKKKAS